jgi:hypothetical protein
MIPAVGKSGAGMMSISSATVVRTAEGEARYYQRQRRAAESSGDPGRP